MAVNTSAIIETKYIEAVATTQYTSPTNTQTIIDKFVVSNDSGGPIDLTIYLVPAGQVVGAEFILIPTRTILDNGTYTCPEIVGHTLEPGDFISALASAGSSLVLRASGRLVT